MFDFFRFDALRGVYHIVGNHSENVTQSVTVGIRQLPYGADVELCQLFGRLFAYHNHLGGRHIADDVHIMLFVKHGRRVGLF